jgi:hypothetical protein
VQAFRSLSSQANTVAVNLATQDSNAKHADEWDSPESTALGHVVHTLDILTVAFAPAVPTIVGEPVHASIEFGNQVMDLIAVRGSSHEECTAHITELKPPRRRPVLVVSRDHDNTKWAKKLGSFLQPLAQPGEEPRITDPSSGMFHLGYQNLLDPFLVAQNAADFAAQVYAELAN